MAVPVEMVISCLILAVVMKNDVMSAPVSCGELRWVRWVSWSVMVRLLAVLVYAVFVRVMVSVGHCAEMVRINVMMMARMVMMADLDAFCVCRLLCCCGCCCGCCW